MKALYILAVGVVALVGCLESHASVGSSAKNEWYSSPSSACQYSGDGLSPGCASTSGGAGAFVGLSSIVWTPVVGVDDGDTLYICGAHLNDRIFIPANVAGSDSSRIEIRFLCPGDRGSISKIGPITEATTAANWTNESGNLWYLSTASYYTKDPRRLWVDTLEQFPANVKTNLGTRVGGIGAVSTFWYDAANMRVYLWSEINPATLHTSFLSLAQPTNGTGCSFATICIIDPSNQYIDILDPIVAGGYTATVTIRGASHIRIRSSTNDPTTCIIGEGSALGVQLIDSSTNGTGTRASNISVRHCTIDPATPFLDAGFSYMLGNVGDGVILSYGVTNTTIAHNLIRNWPHGQIDIIATVGTHAVDGNVIASNTLWCDIRWYCRAFAIDAAALSRATNNWILNNRIVKQNIRSQFNGNGNYLIGNVWEDHRCSTWKPDSCQSLEVQAYAGPTQSNMIAGNIFSANPYAPCLSFRGDQHISSGHVVINNTMLNCGGSIGSGLPNISLWVDDHPNVGGMTFGDNVVFDSGTTQTMQYRANSASSVDEFQASCVVDMCKGNTAALPFVYLRTSGGAE